MILDREQLAWAAGFFDGEGSFVINRRDGLPHPLVAITQTDPRPLNRFMAAFNGMGTVNGPYERAEPNYAPIWLYRAHGFEPVQAIMAMMWPFLCEPKRQQAIEMMTAVIPHARAMIEKAQFCPNGHAMTEENTAFYTQGPGWKARRCRTCHKEHSRKTSERKRVKQAELTEMLRQALNGGV